MVRLGVGVCDLVADTDRVSVGDCVCERVVVIEADCDRVCVGVAVGVNPEVTVWEGDWDDDGDWDALPDDDGLLVCEGDTVDDWLGLIDTVGVPV